MKDISIPTDEQETVITFSRLDKTAEIYTCDTSFIAKMRKLITKDPEHVVVVRQQDGGIWYNVPKTYVKIRPKRRISDEEKKRAAERIKRIQRLNTK